MNQFIRTFYLLLSDWFYHYDWHIKGYGETEVATDLSSVLWRISV